MRMIIFKNTDSISFAQNYNFEMQKKGGQKPPQNERTSNLSSRFIFVDIINNRLINIYFFLHFIGWFS